MKATRWILAIVLAFGCTALMHATPQDQDNDHHAQENRQRTQDRDRAQDRDRNQDRAQDRDDSAYYSSRYYKQGWNDGLKHKQSNRRWKNDTDREAYMAGYAHGDRGEKWQNPNRRRNNNRKRDRDQDRDHDQDHPPSI